MTSTLPGFVHALMLHLRRRGLPLGIDDCQALRLALAAGYGLTSDLELRRLCVALWAKSRAEAALVHAAFAQLDLPVWDAGTDASPDPDRPENEPGGAAPAGATPGGGGPESTVDGVDDADPEPPPVALRSNPSTLAPPSTGSLDPSLVTVPQYPVSEREIAQTWRRLRRPMRYGPPVELDLDGTLDQFARTGVATAPVLRPARRNTARLMMLVDRQGSMTPFHPYLDHVHAAIRHAARIDAIATWYFHDVPGRSRDQSLLATLPHPFEPTLDPVLDRIAPLSTGRVYGEPDLTGSRALPDVLDELTASVGGGTTGGGGTAIAVFSDGGAVRGGLDTGRLLDTVALLVALRRRGALVAWLNPLAPQRWAGTTAGQIARHVPMFPLTREGMYQAVDVLRGRPVWTERPL